MPGHIEVCKFPEKGLRDKVFDLLNELSGCEPELGDQRSLGPMMSAPLPVSLKAHMVFLRRNLNDPHWFRVSADLLHETVAMLGDLLGNPEAQGVSTYGGSESNLTALYALREAGYESVIVPRSAHTSVFKACRVLRMRIFVADVDEELRVVPESVRAIVRETKDNSAILLTAGNTETGVIDDVRAVHDLVPDTPILVDAAFGGLIAPFIRGTRKLPDFDFSIDSVVALSLDGHKTGLTPIPSGILLFGMEDLYNNVVFESEYMGSEKQLSLLWTRTAASVASLWASIKYLGREGFEKIYGECMRIADYAYERLLSEGFSPTRPELPLICIRHYELSGIELLWRLRKIGWYVYSCPSLGGVKITIMPHVTKEIIDAFIDDLVRIAKDIRSSTTLNN